MYLWDVVKIIGIGSEFHEHTKIVHQCLSRLEDHVWVSVRSECAQPARFKENVVTAITSCDCIYVRVSTLVSVSHYCWGCLTLWCLFIVFYRSVYEDRIAYNQVAESLNSDTYNNVLKFICSGHSRLLLYMIWSRQQVFYNLKQTPLVHDDGQVMTIRMLYTNPCRLRLLGFWRNLSIQAECLLSISKK